MRELARATRLELARALADGRLVGHAEGPGDRTHDFAEEA